VISAAFLLRYGKVLAVVAVVGAILAYHTIQLDKAEQRGYDRATAEMAQRVAQANAATAALEQRQREQSQKAAQAWESKRNELQSQVDGLLARKPVVRLCKPASGTPVPGAGSAASRPDDAAGASFDTVSMGQDIGPAAVVLAAECERYRSQLGALQAWVNEALSL
jgi:hypothetical protein